jgi:hypothetical protein
MNLHKEACEKEESYYIDPDSQLRVLTAFFLKKRGFCCGSNCRHCPYSEDERNAAKISRKPRVT